MSQGLGVMTQTLRPRQLSGWSLFVVAHILDVNAGKREKRRESFHHGDAFIKADAGDQYMISIPQRGSERGCF